MNAAIPLSVLIEANECLKLARAAAAPGTYSRILEASVALDARLQVALASQVVEVAA